MPGLYGRFNVEVDGNILTASNYNGEHDNHITNAVPQQHDDYSSNAAQMQAATDPGEVGSESLATSLAGELERLRFAIKEAKGTSQWYESPGSSLATLSNPSSGLAIGLEFDGSLGGASSTTDILAKFINQGGIINAAGLSSADVVASDFSTTSKFGSHSYITGAGNIAAFPGFACNKARGTICAWARGLSASDYVMFNRMLGIEVFMSGGSILTARIQERSAATESTKVTSSVTGTLSGNYVTDQASAFKHILVQYRTAGEAGAATDLLKLFYGGVADGTALTAQTFTGNPGNGGNWFFGSKKNEPATWDHFLANSGLPTAHSSPWTSNGTPGASVSDGVLTINTSATTGFFSKTGAPLAGVNLAAQTVEFKARVNTQTQRTSITQSLCAFSIRDDSLNRSIEFDLYKTSIILNFGATEFEMQIDGTQWHIYRITANGSPSPTVNLYVDDILVFSGVNATADATANDLVQFGVITSGTVNCDFEWLAYADEISAPVAANAGAGFIDSFGVASSILPDAVISALQANPVTGVFNYVPIYGPTIPANSVGNRSGTQNTTSATFIGIDTSLVNYIAGDGITPISFYFSIGLSNATIPSGSKVAIDIDSDFLGLSTIIPYGAANIDLVTANKTLQAVVRRTEILAPGLHTIKPMWLTDAGTVNADETAWIFETSTSKERKLA